MENNIWFIFLGSFLTFLATVLIEVIKNQRSKSEKSNNFKLIIRQELNYIEKTLEKLKTILEYKYYYDYAVLDELTKSTNNLESYKKDAINLSSSLIQGKYIDLVSDLKAWISSARNIQDNFYTEERKLKEDSDSNKGKKKNAQKTSNFKDMEQLVNTFNIRNIEKSTDLIEIKRQLDEFLKLIEDKPRWVLFS